VKPVASYLDGDGCVGCMLKLALTIGEFSARSGVACRRGQALAA
jgi:hypothetical protein